MSAPDWGAQIPRAGVSAERALSLILERVDPIPGVVTLSVARAGGRRLARDITAERDVPPFDNAGMDGYAVRVDDLAASPVALRLDGETAAGDPAGDPLAPGGARAIMTGAPIPPGADAVVQVEWTERGAGGTVRVLKEVARGTNIRRRGSDVGAGSVPLAKGRLVRPFEQGVLASLGMDFVEVRRAPSVLIVPTGNELAADGRSAGPGMIRDAITPVLAGLARNEGCDVTVLPVVRDEAALLEVAVVPGPGIDLVITTGGVSAGRHDLLPGALAAAGFETVFHGVNIKPGRPMLFGVRGRVPVFALPGNPVSAAVTFLQFVRPAVRKMAGDPDPARRTALRARLIVPVAKADGKRHYLRGVLDTAGGEPVVRPVGPQESNVASALADANCLIVLPETGREWEASSTVEVELL